MPKGKDNWRKDPFSLEDDEETRGATKTDMLDSYNAKWHTKKQRDKTLKDRKGALSSADRERTGGSGIKCVIVTLLILALVGAAIYLAITYGKDVVL